MFLPAFSFDSSLLKANILDFLATSGSGKNQKAEEEEGGVEGENEVGRLLELRTSIRVLINIQRLY